MSRIIVAGLFAALVACSFSTVAALADDQSIESFTPTQLHELEAASKIAAATRARATHSPGLAAGVDQTGFDVRYYHIDIRIDDEMEQVYGAVSMVARPYAGGFNSPTLNLLDDMAVDSVTSDGAVVGWSHAGGFVFVTLPQTYAAGEDFELTIYYHGHPTEGGFQGFAFASHAGVPIISTLSEPYMAQSWWPCKDTPSDKADSVDMIVTVNPNLYVVSNGVLRDSVGNLDGTATYHWHESHPITTYLVSLAITNYARFTRWYHHGTDSMPVQFYSYPELLTTAQGSWPIAVSQIGALAGYYGEYPFLNEKYGIAHFTWGGAMEHQTVSSHTSSTSGFNQYLTVHELSHQWWGDMVTCRDWHHIWLNEGFASYSEALWAEHQSGAASYRSYMQSMQYLSGGRIYIDDTTDLWNIFSTRVYDKGAWVLHMLRGIVGDPVFFEILQTYYNHPDHQYKDAVTEDFRDIAESVYGSDLDWFFEDWIYGYYYPSYTYSVINRVRGDGKYDMFINLRQNQTTAPAVFRMPVDMALTTAGVVDTVRFWNDARDQNYWLVFDAPTSVTQFDPKNWVLDQTTTEAYRLQIVTPSLLPAGQYAEYKDSIVAACGNLSVPITLSLISGTLPSGLTWNAASGTIAGRPLDTADAVITIRADATGFPFDTQTFVLSVAEAAYVPGDQNGDRILDALDVVGIIDYVFRGALPPDPLNVADPNHDCVSNAADVVTIINHVWRGYAVPGFGCLE